MIMLRIAMNTLRTSSSPGDISCTISFVHHVAEELFGTLILRNLFCCSQCSTLKVPLNPMECMILSYETHGFFEPKLQLHLSFSEKVLSFSKKGTIVFMKKYYRFAQKVLSFLAKDTIVFCRGYYRLPQKVLSSSVKGTIEATVPWYGVL